jgi:hypothetical protein
MMRRLLCCGALAGALLLGGPLRAEPPAIDPEASDVLRRMSDHMRSLEQFSFRSETTSDEILVPTGQRLQFANDVDVFVRRPNRLRADSQGDLQSRRLYYDGTSVTLHGVEENLYASTAAPPTIDATMTFLLDELGLDAPLADFIFHDPYAVLTENATGGLYAGLHYVRGVLCHHLAFTQDDIEWQLWVEAGDSPLPRKLVITSKQEEGSPQFTAVLLHWNPSRKLDDGIFRFEPPEGAEQIEFLRPTSNPMPGE